jgi:hypothetical protein
MRSGPSRRRYLGWSLACGWGILLLRPPALAAQDLYPEDVLVPMDSALKLAQRAAAAAIPDLPEYLLYAIAPRVLKGDPRGLHWQVTWQERAFPHRRSLVVRVYMKDGQAAVERE